MKGRVKWSGKFHCCLTFRNCITHRNPQQPPPWSVSSHRHWDRTLHQQKDGGDSLKAQTMPTYFILETKCCVLRSVHRLFRHKGTCTLNRLPCQHTIMCSGNEKICVILFIVTFTLLPWSGTQPTVSPRLASIYMAFSLGFPAWN